MNILSNIICYLILVYDHSHKKFSSFDITHGCVCIALNNNIRNQVLLLFYEQMCILYDKCQKY